MEIKKRKRRKKSTLYNYPNGSIHHNIALPIEIENWIVYNAKKRFKKTTDILRETIINAYLNDKEYQLNI